MGELWANMDKIDIREERRNREETRKKIEKLHGSKKEGMDSMKKKKWVIAGSGIVILGSSSACVK